MQGHDGRVQAPESPETKSPLFFSLDVLDDVLGDLKKKKKKVMSWIMSWIMSWMTRRKRMGLCLDVLDVNAIKCGDDVG